MSDLDRPQQCPKCGGDSERQISGGAGVIFRGPGFYETDKRNKKVKEERKGAD
jgi:predicted nucleic acid-binding Zn ribbon protein